MYTTLNQPASQSVSDASTYQNQPRRRATADLNSALNRTAVEDDSETKLDTKSIIPRNVWFPKLSPYRIIVLSTTISFGTAKVISSLNGNKNLSTTLEWIFGVVIFLVLHTISIYDGVDGLAAPRFLAWLFESDCMEAFWFLIFSIYRIKRPSYDSDEIIPRHTTSWKGEVNAPIFTTYRLLVSSTIATLGLLKAGLVYGNVPTAADWLDWLFGVVATSILYILGLYEFNSIRLWHGFFSVDRSRVIVPTRKLLVRTMCIYAWTVVSSIWIGISTYVLVLIILRQSFTEFLDYDTPSGVSTFRQLLFAWILSLAIIFGMFAGLLCYIIVESIFDRESRRDSLNFGRDWL